MPRRLIMLDFDGVIVDSLEATYEGAAKFLEEHGPRHLASPDALLSILDHNWYEGMAQAGLTPEVAHALDAAIMEGLGARIEEIAAVPGMPQAIEQLSLRHTVLVITSNFAWFVDAVFDHIGVRGVAEVVGADGEKSKVKKIARACARHPHPGGCCYVGDTVGDIVEARLAGVPSVAVTWGWHAEDRLQAASPDAVARDPGELVRIVSADGLGVSAPDVTAAAHRPDGHEGGPSAVHSS